MNVRGGLKYVLLAFCTETLLWEIWNFLVAILQFRRGPRKLEGRKKLERGGEKSAGRSYRFHQHRHIKNGPFRSEERTQRKMMVQSPPLKRRSWMIFPQVKAHELLSKSKTDLQSQLTELKQELLQLRVQKVAGGNSAKLTKM